MLIHPVPARPVAMRQQASQEGYFSRRVPSLSGSKIMKKGCGRRHHAWVHVMTSKCATASDTCCSASKPCHPKLGTWAWSLWLGRIVEIDKPGNPIYPASWSWPAGPMWSNGPPGQRVQDPQERSQAQGVTHGGSQDLVAAWWMCFSPIFSGDLDDYSTKNWANPEVRPMHMEGLCSAAWLKRVGSTWWGLHNRGMFQSNCCLLHVPHWKIHLPSVMQVFDQKQAGIWGNHDVLVYLSTENTGNKHHADIWRKQYWAKGEIPWDQ